MKKLNDTQAKGKNIFGLLILAVALFPILSYAECVELLPKGAQAPAFRQPRLYSCQAVVPGAVTNEEGIRLSREKAQAEAETFFATAEICRGIGSDQAQSFRSFCNPMSACTNFITYLYFSCGGMQ